MLTQPDLRRLSMTALALFGVVFAAGCSGSDSPSGPGSLNPAGTGSMTLHVDGDISGSDDGGGLFSTNFTVVVSDGVGPVSGATISVQGPFGTIALLVIVLAWGLYHAVKRVDNLPSE